MHTKEEEEEEYKSEHCKQHIKKERAFMMLRLVLHNFEVFASHFYSIKKNFTVIFFGKKTQKKNEMKFYLLMPNNACFVNKTKILLVSCSLE